MIMRSAPRWFALVLLFVVAFVIFVSTWWLAVLPLIVAEEGIPSFGWSDVGRYLHWIVTPSEWEDEIFWLYCFAAISSTAHVAFVAPLVGPPRLSGEGRSLRTTVIGASILGGLISVGALLALAQLLLLAFGESPSIDGFGRVTEAGAIAIVFLAWIMSGAAWMFLLRKVGRSRDPNGTVGLLRTLLAGTCIELALSIPVYVLARRREDCYCALPTFYSIISGTAALVWMCGPWAVLWLTREYRRGWRRNQCGRCGYPRQSGSPCCSECGLDFREAAEEPTAESRG